MIWEMVYFGHENSEILVMALANFSKKELGFGICQTFVDLTYLELVFSAAFPLPTS